MINPTSKFSIVIFMFFLFLNISNAQHKQLVTWDIEGNVKVLTATNQLLLGLTILDNGFSRCRMYRQADSSYIFEQVNTDNKNPMMKSMPLTKQSGDSLLLVIRRAITMYRNYLSPNDLPLAQNNDTYNNASFQTLYFVASFGLTRPNLSGVFSLASSPINTIFLSPFFLVHIPITDKPILFIRSGWNIPLNTGTVGPAFSASIFYSLKNDISPVIGIGIGKSTFFGGGDPVVSAAQTYPLINIGVTIVQNYLDIIATIPLSEEMTTTYEGKKYSINVAGPEVGLFFSF